MDNALLLPTNNFVFYKLLVDNPELLADFLQATLDRPAADFLGLEILNPELPPEFYKGKHCILDIKIKLNSGELIDLEAQVKKQQAICHRLYFYTAKMSNQQLNSGNVYADLKKTVSIVVARFKIIEYDVYYHHKFRLFDDKHGVPYRELVEIHTIELPKIRVPDGTQLGNWACFFKIKNEVDLMKVAKLSPMIGKACEQLQILSADEKTRMYAEDAEKAQRDLESFYYEGRAEEREEIASRLIDKGYSDAEILEIMGTTKKWLSNFKKSLNQKK